jgi:hypothetical protein
MLRMSLDITLHAMRETQVFYRNITHNLTEMAEAAGIYQIVWRPDESGIEKAVQLIEPLQAALSDLRARPEHYKQYDAPNGWGRYHHFLEFIQDLLSACEKNPDARVEVSR